MKETIKLKVYDDTVKEINLKSTDIIFNAKFKSIKITKENCKEVSKEFNYDMTNNIDKHLLLIKLDNGTYKFYAYVSDEVFNNDFDKVIDND